MASKVPKKIFDIQKKLVTYQIRITKFFKHKLLAQRKNVLLIGGDSHSQFKQKLQQKLLKTCTLTGISLKYMNQQHKSSQDFNIQIDLTKPQYNKFFIPTSLQAKIHLYKEIQQKLKGKHFDAIVVLPQKESKDQIFDIDSQWLITKYNPLNDIFSNLLAYRLAHKYLSTSGVLIFSTSQKDFLKDQKQEKLKKTQQNKLIQAQQQMTKDQRDFASKYMLQCQKQYLGVIVGDRDYTDLNSWSVIGLSQQVVSQDPQYVSQAYRNWAQGIRLPMPGSFALFRRKNQQIKKCSHVQYL